MYVIVLSGPKAALTQLKAGLQAAGFVEHHDQYDRGLEAGKSGRTPHAFYVVQGDDVARAAQIAGTLGWSLRLHAVRVHEIGGVA